MTQSTTVTKDSAPTRTRPAPGLKRRLTRHSDLVSVLSLPDDSSIPGGIRDKRSRPSLRKAKCAVDVTTDELLREFIDDENLYLRQLKTMVDGVVPVLLSDVVYSTNATELFGINTSTPGTYSLSRSVVSMGVSLEKLNNAHKKAPTSDIRKLSHWAHGIVPIYSSYLSAWRLGFEDLVVNLAPAQGSMGDDDSLLNALPRNESGDLVNAHGERVAVAYLLKRPLIRVKQLSRFFQCVDAIQASSDTHELVRDFEVLQEKARRRHKEETARMTDADAISTDTSRARDLATLQSVSGPIKIDSSRQVNAKDLFSLNLAHSNGQRLECQVELVHRDKQSHPDDEGDLLVRETGDLRSFLLFAPMPMSTVSARMGLSGLEMVVLVRGTRNGKEWQELLTLGGETEEQIQEWLEIIPLAPVPPTELAPKVISRPSRPSTPEKSLPDVPVGAPSELSSSPRSPIAKNLAVPSPSPSPETRRPLPSRYRPRSSTRTTEPSPAASSGDEEPARTPTRQSAYTEERSQRPSDARRTDQRNAWPERPALVQSEAEDTPPPPPVHRSPPKSSLKGMEMSKPILPPVVDKQSSDRIKRRGSSPLKHEYLPSDTSSTSGAYSTEESDLESSDDEIESVEIPETELGVSIKRDSRPEAGSQLSAASACSLTPSNSASQAGLHGPKTTPEEKAERFIAAVSRWSEKGVWKDVWADPCSVIVKAGLVEAYSFRKRDSEKDDRPLLALDLTPLVLIRQSTALDLEVRSSVQPHCLLHPSHSGGNFRFRCHSAPECFSLYMSVHHARLNNQKFIQLENESRFKSFGERSTAAAGEGSSSSRRRGWFGRKKSYRGSVRAPSNSHDGTSTTPSSVPSASTFLKKLAVAGNLSFNIARSSVDRQGAGGGNSLYTQNSSSSGPPLLRSPSISMAESGQHSGNPSTENINIRLHLLLAAAARWEDYGNCSLQIRRPPPGWRQALRANHGLEKRVTVTTVPKKDVEAPKVVLDAVLGSGCFSAMGSRGIVCGVWEEVKDDDGVVGMVPATGATGGNIKKWCLQFATAGDAAWVLRLLHQEVLRA